MRCATVKLKPTRCLRTRGGKGDKHADPPDPPRRRANNQRGHGTYDNDRPPVVGTIGRAGGQCRPRVCAHTGGKTLRQHVHQFTQRRVTCYTDEWQGYNNVERAHGTVCRSQHEWARDDDGDGVREVHTDTIEGLWTATRNFLRPFRGVHKKHLRYYLAVCEHGINLRRITPNFIAQLVAKHQLVT